MDNCITICFTFGGSFERFDMISCKVPTNNLIGNRFCNILFK